MKILVTGGAGFIGSNLIHYLLKQDKTSVLNLDKLTYAGNLKSLSSVSDSARYQFQQIDICYGEKLNEVLNEFKPDAVMHLAAESHVDRSIDGPGEFIQTNVVGTYTLLQACRGYYEGLKDEKQKAFRFLHVSTDEVFGSLGDRGFFTETTPYDPRSPYSSSKASSDHLVRAWGETYNLPVLITNCSNNYGPYQFPEKLIPVVILKALSGQDIPVYGKGENVRDWLYVEDHCDALWTVLNTGVVGETYNIGGENEQKNIDLVTEICSCLDKLRPQANGKSYSELITFVKDRPGHDFRYAMDISKIRKELGWAPKENQSSGLTKTIQWYLDNQDWWQAIIDGEYQLERLGHG